MRKGALPRELDLRGLAAREASISGVAAITDLGRLMSAGVGLVAPASAAFEFRRDEEGRYGVEAQITAEVVLECQRCLGEMTQLLETRTVMACIWDDEDAAQLPSSYEPLIVQETANLSDIVEEELLLALPASPMHAEDCITDAQRVALGDEEGCIESEGRKESPFAVLAKLKS
jgi:uncharacterized protein